MFTESKEVVEITFANHGDAVLAWVFEGIIICRIYHRLCGVMLKKDQPATSFLVVGKTVMQIKFGSTPASRQVIEKQAMSTQAINKAQNNIREHIHDVQGQNHGRPFSSLAALRNQNGCAIEFYLLC